MIMLRVVRSVVRVNVTALYHSFLDSLAVVSVGKYNMYYSSKNYLQYSFAISEVFDLAAAINMRLRMGVTARLSLAIYITLCTSITFYITWEVDIAR